MTCKIIGQNHSVTTYLLNGRKRFIVDDIEVTNNRRVVNNVIREIGSREWSKVYNYIDDRLQFDLFGYKAKPMTKGMETTIDSMTY
jgi:hypothetical protein